MSDRPSVFDNDDDLNLTQFQAKPKPASRKPSSALVRQVATEGGFPSRAAASPPREPMTYRTGRSATFATKTTPETLEAFYEIAKMQKWKVGETFEKAVELLVQTYGS